MFKNFFRQACNSLILVLLWTTLSFAAYPNVLAADGAKSSRSKPLIGINLEVVNDPPVTYEITEPYTAAIKKAGGIPILIPPMGKDDLVKVFSMLDGVMLIGGLDYPPSMYGKKPHKTIVLMHKKRTEFDTNFANLVLNNKKIPFLGICAGAQIVNIKSGGSLIRDVPSAYPKSRVKHSSPNGWQVGFRKHMVNFADGSKISNIYGKKKLTVVSSHHQCVDKVGKGLKITSWAPDGVKESYEGDDKNRFFIGVQWHPERDYETNKPLFDEFIKQSKQYGFSRLQEEKKLAERNK